MRLRPSGNAGPLVTKMSSFTAYQQNDAWTWEHMALTQASVIAGSPELVARLNAGMAEVICRPRDKRVLADDVAAMRQRLFEHQKMRGPLDVKNGPGGLIDIEFLVQALILAYAADCPAIIAARGLAATLEKLHAADLLSRGDYELLLEAGSYYAALRQISGLCLEPDSDAIGQGATEMVLNAVHAPDAARLQTQLGQFREDVSAAFTRVMAALRRIDGLSGAG
jgi:glutamate-ammonia-ligase adenylyltransferase